MPTIRVDHPFSLRVSSDAELREFGKGQHTISQDELDHWFIQGCLEQGRATQLVGADSETEQEFAETALKKLNNEKLKEIAAALGATIAPDATKAIMVAAILEAKARTEGK